MYLCQLKLIYQILPATIAGKHLGEMKQYDVFVSYRRESFAQANLIAEKLRKLGYSVFFDIDTLRSNKFNEQLLDAINNCSDFILILPPHALDRCDNEKDWVRAEVLHALQQKKNIIPILLTGFEWPEEMPAGLEELPYYQSIKVGDVEFFDQTVARLAGYLLSRPHKDMRKFWKKFVAVFIAICVLGGVGVSVMYHMAAKLCLSVATTLTFEVSNLNALRLAEEKMMGLWQDIQKTTSNKSYKNDRELIEISKKTYFDGMQNLMQNIDVSNNSVARVEQFTTFESFLLGLYGHTPQDIYAFNGFFDASYADVHYLANLMNLSIQNDSTDVLGYAINNHFDAHKYVINSVYYLYVSTLSKMPSMARKLGLEKMPEWTIFADLARFGLTQEEYNSLAEIEMKKYQEKANELRIYMERTMEKLKQQEEYLNISK